MAGEVTIGRLLVEILMDASGYDKGVDKVVTKTTKLDQVLNKSAKKIGGAFTAAIKAATVAVAGLAAASTIVGANFEDAMARVAAVKGVQKTSDDFAALEKQARALGASTMFSATQAAQGMEELARAGLSTTEIITASADVLKLAAGASIDLASAAQVTAATMKQFSLDAADTQRITDVLTVTTQNSLFAMTDLAQAMKFAGTVGSSLGMSLEETSVAVAQFRDLGLEGSLAGTQFRMAMAAAAKVTDQAAAALDKYGLSAQDINPQLHSFKEIMLTIGEAGLTVGDAMQIFGTRAGGSVKKVADIMAESSESYDSLFAKLERSAGATTQTYEIMTDTVKGTFLELKSAAQEALITLFDTFSGPLTTLLESVTGFIRKLVDEFGLVTNAVEGGFASALEDLAGFIDREGRVWARWLAGLAVKLSALGAIVVDIIIPAFVKLVPLLDDIATIMAIIWTTQKVAAFGTAVWALVPALGAVTAGLTTAGVALAGATAGISVVMAGFAALALVMWDLADSTDAAAIATDRLREAEAAAEAQREGLLVVEERMAEAQAHRTAVALQTIASEEGLNDAQERELSTLVELTDRTAAAGKARGDFIEISNSLFSTEFALQELGETGRRGVDATIDGLHKRIAAARKSIEVNQDDRAEVERLNEAIAKDEKAVLRLEAAIRRTSQATSRSTKDFEDFGERLEEIEGGGKKVEKVFIEVADAFGNKVKMQVTDKAQSMGKEFNAGFSWPVIQATNEMASGFEKLPSKVGPKIKQFGRTAIDVAGKVGKAFSEVGQGIVDSFNTAFDAVKGIFDGMLGFLEDLTGFTFDLGDAVQTVVDAEAAALAGAGAEGGGGAGTLDTTRGVDVGAAAAQAMIEGLVDKAVTFVTALVRALPAIIDGLVAEIPRLLQAVAEAIGPLIQTLADAIPRLVQIVVDEVPNIIQALLDGIPDLVDGLTEAAGIIIDMIDDMLPKFIDQILGMLPEFLETTLAMLPRFIEVLIGAIGEIISGIIKAIPLVITAILNALPDIITGIIDGLMDAITNILTSIVEAIPDIIQGVIDAIPRIITSLLEAVGTIITTILRLIPTLIMGIIQSLPDLLESLIAFGPELIKSIVVGIPKLIFELLKELFFEMPKGIPVMIKTILEAIWGAIKQFFAAIGDVFQFIFQHKKWEEKRDDQQSALNAAYVQEQRKRGIAPPEMRDKANDVDGAALAGIRYVPGEARMRVHAGEAILPKHLNPFAPQGQSGAPAMGMAGGGGQGPVNLSLFVDGEMIDKIIVNSTKNGTATGVQKMVDRGTRTRFALARGRFNPFGS